MTYTNSQIRAAFYAAAARIDATPTQYSFRALAAPKDSGGCGCMWGWVGFELGMKGSCNRDVAVACGQNSTSALYDFMLIRCSDTTKNARSAARMLREFADHTWPAAAPTVADPSRALVPWSQCVWQPKTLRVSS